MDIEDMDPTQPLQIQITVHITNPAPDIIIIITETADITVLQIPTAHRAEEVPIIQTAAVAAAAAHPIMVVEAMAEDEAVAVVTVVEEAAVEADEAEDNFMPFSNKE